jgi:hypothetical protein
MSSIAFPFEIENGKVKLALDDIDAQVQRVVNYAVTDIPYCFGIGAGIEDIVFSVGTGGSATVLAEENIKNALKKISGLSNVVVYFQKNGVKLSINVSYAYNGQLGNTVTTFGG